MAGREVVDGVAGEEDQVGLLGQDGGDDGLVGGGVPLGVAVDGHAQALSGAVGSGGLARPVVGSSRSGRTAACESGPQAAVASRAAMATWGERASIVPFYPPRRRSEKGGRPSDSSRAAISIAGLDGG